MGKRSFNRKNKGKGKGGYKKVKTQWKCSKIPEDHQMFRKYYEAQLGLAKEDFQEFWAKMKEKLPVVFRVNPNCPNFDNFKHQLEDQNFMKNIIPPELFQQVEKQEKGQQQVQGAKKQQQANYEPKQLPKLEPIPWYPGNLVYTFNTSKQTFKKSKILSEFHKYLQKAFDSGLVSRQELVSMLPPLYLDIGPDDRVLDMCAAPGSKTSQILEMMYGDKRWLTKGCVIANDADYSRAQMLIHQLHRSGTTGMAVINHPGQFMPELYTQKVGSVKQKFQFDKILCDVPCSGDGATRKLPIKWANWHTSDGMVLHPLQLSILMKGINLLKRGGYLVYSTCSLNPIQNQAVVNALFTKIGKGLELIDIHPLYNVKGRRGMNKWKVCTIVDDKQKPSENENQQKQSNKKILKEFASYQQAQYIHKIKQTMFPCEDYPNKPDLSHTMRVLPHDQNSGGFYVALIKKLPDFEWKYTAKTGSNQNKDKNDDDFLENNMPECDQVVIKQVQQKVQQAAEKQQSEGEKQSSEGEEQQQQIEEKPENIEKSQKIQQKKSKKQIPSKYETYVNLDEEQFLNIQKFFGLDDEFRKLLYVRDLATARKKVLLVSEGVRNFLEADLHNKMKLVNMGCVAFEKGKQSFAGHECLYRLCQDGIHFMLPHIKQRKIKVSLNFFKKVLSVSTLAHDQIQDENIRTKISQMTQGSFCIYIDQQINEKRIIDVMVGQNFKNSFHLLVSKQDLASLSIRYL